MYAVDVHAHSRHDLHAVLEGKHNALLCRPEEMFAAVDIEVEAFDDASRLAIFEYPFRSITEGDDAESFRSYRHLFSHAVHVFVAASFAGDMAVHPRVENTRAVDAEQYAQSRFAIHQMVDMGKGVDS